MGQADTLLPLGLPVEQIIPLQCCKLWHYMLQMENKNLEKKYDQWLKATFAQVMDEPTKQKKTYNVLENYFLNRITIVIMIIIIIIIIIIYCT